VNSNNEMFNAVPVRGGSGQPIGWLARLLTFLCLLGLGLRPSAARGEDTAPAGAAGAPEVAYKNYREAKGPRSIHVVRVPRDKSPFQVMAVHAGAHAVGLGGLSEQVRTVDPALGVCLAAINGDFYQRAGAYAGDPRGLQIVEGELISAPSGSASFWIDAVGEPHVTNTVSLLQVTWPDGTTSPLGFNGTRQSREVELYTPALGPSTHTSGGREIILEQPANGPWLPLRVGKVYHARVASIRQGGDSRILPGTLVLSIGPGMARTCPNVAPGADLLISTETRPSLRGARTAISGGPVLVRGGKRQRLRASEDDSYESSSMLERHPRSALGWNDEAYFLVEVDGRQKGSVGMTLDELASYLVQLGCQEALNLDGGGSATLWFQGQVRNRPCDGYERAIANALVVVQKPAGTAPEKSPPTAARLHP
jgi:Phosphodiester glycosidase